MRIQWLAGAKPLGASDKRARSVSCDGHAMSRTRNMSQDTTLTSSHCGDPTEEDRLWVCDLGPSSRLSSGRRGALCSPGQGGVRLPQNGHLPRAGHTVTAPEAPWLQG